MDFKKRKLYKLQNKKFGSTFEGRLGESTHLSHGPYLTGKDHNGMKCLLPIAAINCEFSQWELLEEEVK